MGYIRTTIDFDKIDKQIAAIKALDAAYQDKEARDLLVIMANQILADIGVA